VLVEYLKSRSTLVGKYPTPEVEPHGVVDVEQTTDAAPNAGLVRTRWQDRDAGLFAQIRPSLAAGVHVFELESRITQVRRQPDCVTALAKLAEFFDLLRPSVWYGGANVREDSVGGDGVEFHVASGRQIRKASLDLADEVLSRTAEKCPEPSVEPELLAMMANEVKHCADVLLRSQPKTAPELLEEQCRAVRGTEQQQSVDDWDVHAFVEEVDGEHDADPSGGEVDERLPAIFRRTVRPHRHRLDTGGVEDTGHES
jgi:hypothetical protein